MLTFRLVDSLQSVDLTTAQIGTFYVTPNGEAFELSSANQLGGIGSFFKKLGSIALPIAGAVLAPITGGLSVPLSQAGAGLLAGMGSGSSGQAKGLAAINAYGQKVISTLDQVLSSGQISGEILQAAEQLVNSLSDSTYVYQAKKGNDAAALTNFKQQAAAKLDQVRQMAAQAAQATQQPQPTAPGTITAPGGGQVVQTGTTPTGQPIYAIVQSPSNSGGILSGIDSNTLFLIGGIALAVYVLKK